ncbi:MAG: DNA recombination protein RmuC, partial [Bacteroidetes bacterium]|nr:DNA recombination protein RmuC [Candidatus Merdivivens pullicola]
RKDYNSHLPRQKQLVDFNIMFMPVEAAFQLMMTSDPLLWQNARSRGVLIVSQMNLLVFLQMIGMGWKQALQERHITEVYRMAEGIQSQLLGFLQYMDKVGDALKSAEEAYEDALKRLNGSNQSVVSKLKRLEDFGVKSGRKGKGLPKRFADN